METRKIVIEWEAQGFGGVDWKKIIEAIGSQSTKFLKMEINYGNKTRKN